MKKTLNVSILTGSMLLTLAACGENANEDNNNINNDTTNENNNEAVSEEEAGELEGDDQVITFGVTTWTSTEAPTEIISQILQDEGYEVDFEFLDQPIIWEGLANEDIDFFMDAWLPYTEEELWNEYEDELQQVTVSYEEAPLGWVVPEYVAEDSISDLIDQGDKYDNQVLGIDPGAGIVTISEDVMDGYDLHDEYELLTSSEPAMLSDVQSMVENEEPVVFTGWRPHSMFADMDLKFLEDEEEYFKEDDVYVLSYEGVEEKHPEVYEILSNWEIEVSDLEEMMLEYEEDDRPFEESAEEWIEENEEQVEEMVNS
ncbi:glycine betaine ABC transporter substrate-binding protein [Salisediminibacterium halotolerans]|uniref:Glycine betaine/proline transport system substrate-binding protein n=1 Tax=Salisediminibacterium halotolerans TaxID=517425 RepID=A0A1H9WXS2_9BACI|nr:glycine betaine ABC transporter substrate-binding protein [Salisediminibacterium haloalkalitolerans]SES38728.1 glycine betaine/proline transport system substrate-binding protein [Salisediminibacterium haloalkalitolerans]